MIMMIRRKMMMIMAFDDKKDDNRRTTIPISKTIVPKIFFSVSTLLSNWSVLFLLMLSWFGLIFMFGTLRPIECINPETAIVRTSFYSSTLNVNTLSSTTADPNKINLDRNKNKINSKHDGSNSFDNDNRQRPHNLHQKQQQQQQFTQNFYRKLNNSLHSLIQDQPHLIHHYHHHHLRRQGLLSCQQHTNLINTSHKHNRRSTHSKRKLINNINNNNNNNESNSDKVYQVKHQIQAQAQTHSEMVSL